MTLGYSITIVQKTLSPLLRLYLFLLLAALPMDWFSWTGQLLREGGARPAIPIMTLGSIYMLVLRSRSVSKILQNETKRQLVVFGLIASCGAFGFCVNIWFSWSYFGGGKDPFFQFMSQSVLFLLMPILLVGHAALFKSTEVRETVMQYLPWVAAIHLAVLGLEAANVLVASNYPLSLFRNVPDYLESDYQYRFSGLLSEPSYFGNTAALYGLPLILIKLGKNKLRILHIGIGVALVVAACLIGARTVIPTILFGISAFGWQTRYQLFTPSRLLVVLTVIVAAVGAASLMSALDVSGDLSSAYRLGSVVTALNVARAGYGLSGLGFGQFHFMYKIQFVPSFALSSSEVATQLSTGVESRASTFNLFARYLVETGIVGLGLWVSLIWRYIKIGRFFQDPSLALGATMMGASIGFLTTQDPYCFPPLIFGMALILGTYLERCQQRLLSSEHMA
jgi:hypothetical protein